MNKNTFERFVEDTLDICKAVLTRKSGEYSSSEDKLHNFDKAKELMRCNTKEFALWGMFAKHLVSVTDMVERFEKTGEIPTSNMIDEKIGDSINYFILLKACFYDDMIKEERKDPPIVKKIIEEAFNTSCFDKNKDIEVLRKEQAAMANSNNDKQDIETLKKEQALIANSLWNNARKRLVVEKLRKMLKPMFIYLTDNNRFIDYEKIKGILNRAELERDSVPDDFVCDAIVAIEQLDLVSAEGYQKRDETITNVIQVMLQPKYKIGDEIWSISSGLDGNNWQLFNMIVDDYFIYPDDKTIGYKSMFDEALHEKYCFKTKSEAQRECDNRNNTNAAK